MDVKTDVGVGGFSSSLPVVVGSMGSTDTASKTTLAIARGAARAEGYNIVANRWQALRRGHVVKSLALGASSTYMARPFLIAALARGEKGVENYIESLKVEIQMFTSVLGKYDVKEISSEDVASLDKDVAEMLGIPYIYS
jgi:isopentenyl diphosphate isomerase/L-lactate dehydrogenase-like FMN-dependent dehydrogenase